MSIKTAYVTGGASGIGLAVVQMLATRGVRVAIADRNFAGAQSVASTINGAIAVEIDASDWDSQLGAFKRALEEFIRIDYVYAVAGIGERKWIPNDPHAVDFSRPDMSVLDVDLTGPLYTAALAIQQMRRQAPDEKGLRGKIAIAASVCGFYCIPTLPLYTAAKHGVVGFVRSYGKHLPTEAITLNAVCPNIVKTNISTNAFYDQVEPLNLLVPMSSVVEAFERCLDSEILGETLEVETHSGIIHRSAPEPLDNAAVESLGMLHRRAAPLHEPTE
ncbi:Monensin polyketide synthase ketoacyl reductase [Lecanosticta acicola]|uniref:Monensin polyketide synthase ketoacyl reductase n=1 Tax=Lecanosticta acicola TaxID=111012 RepID=A0AAI8Z2S1_9PEZI|nr:Monensin polyketide synthase ketoacyl reductase [Lecanosticta acicola]